MHITGLFFIQMKVFFVSARFVKYIEIVLQLKNAYKQKQKNSRACFVSRFFISTLISFQLFHEI